MLRIAVDKPNFASDVQEGAWFEGYVVSALSLCGFKVTMGARRIHDPSEDIDEAFGLNQVDLYVGRAQTHVEVKALRYAFTTPDTVPFDPLSIGKYRAGPMPTQAYAIVSRKTGSIVASLPGQPRFLGAQFHRGDNAHYTSVQVRRAGLSTFEELCEYLRAMEEPL